MPPILSVRFYCTKTGKEPVRDWLLEQVSPAARKAIGADIKTVQFGWPIGVPVVRKIELGACAAEAPSGEEYVTIVA